MEQSILAAICYFDVFDYPLTLLEIWQWLFTPTPLDQAVSLSAVKTALEDSEYLKSRINFKNGFYFLNNRGGLIAIRLKRYGLSGQKNKIAMKGVGLLRFLPFIKLVGLCNNSGNNNIREDSDIDLFIITSSKRLFTARFLITLALSLVRLRRHDKKITDRLCLSFYVSQDDLDFSKIKIAASDVYLVYWIANLFPLYDRGAYDNFLAQNSWIKKYLPNHLAKAGSFRRQVFDNMSAKLSHSSLEYILGGFMGDLLERLLKKIQFLKMSKNNKSLARENDSRVIISDTMLKFHENDRRLFYQDNFLARLKEITQ